MKRNESTYPEFKKKVQLDLYVQQQLIKALYRDDIDEVRALISKHK